MTETQTLFGTANAAVSFLKHLGPGDIAELRRLDPAEARGPAFWKVATGPLAHEFDGLTGVALDARERTWATVLRSYAVLEDLLQARQPLGRALVEAKVQELRFERLPTARS